MACRSILNCFPVDSSYIYIFMSYTVRIVYIVNPSPTLASLLLIFWPLSLPQTWVLFQRGVLLLPTYLPGLKSPQAHRRIKPNAVLSLFWLELEQTKWPHCMLVPATPMISDFTRRKMPQVHTRVRGQGHRNPKLRGRQGNCPPLNPY